MRMPSWAPGRCRPAGRWAWRGPRAHGQAMISTATAAVNALRAGVAGGEPADQREPRASTSTIGHEHGRHAVRQPLHVGLARLRLLDEARDAGQRGVGPHPCGAHHQASAGVHGGAGDGVVRDRPRPARARPVSMEASTADVPSSTTPSVAICSPGRTTKRIPTASCSIRHGARRRPPARRPPWRRATAALRAPRRSGAWPWPPGSGR